MACGNGFRSRCNLCSYQLYNLSGQISQSDSSLGETDSSCHSSALLLHSVSLGSEVNIPLSHLETSAGPSSILELNRGLEKPRHFALYQPPKWFLFSELYLYEAILIPEKTNQRPLIIIIFKMFRSSDRFLYLFILGCTGSLLLCAGFLQLQRAGLLFVVVHGLLTAVASLVAEHKLQAHGLQQLQLKCSGVVVHRLCCSTTYRIFLGSNPYPLHWQADSYPLCHQGFCLSLFFDSLATGLQDFKEFWRDMSTGSKEADRAQPFPTQHPRLLACHFHASPGKGLVMSMFTMLVLCPFLFLLSFTRAAPGRNAWDHGISKRTEDSDMVLKQEHHSCPAKR